MDELRAAAVQALGDVLRDKNAKPADRLRAAEAILRADREGLAPPSDVNELTDEALLLIAREGGTPPKRGPAESRSGAVPSHAHAEQLPATRSASAPAATSGGVELPGLVTPDNPFMRRGPKEDPSQRAPRGVPSAKGPAMGPKEDPAQEGAPEPWM